jgi:hypothetical protein
MRVWTLHGHLGLRERPGGPPGNYLVTAVTGTPLQIGEDVPVIELSSVLPLVEAIMRQRDLWVEETIGSPISNDVAEALAALPPELKGGG